MAKAQLWMLSWTGLWMVSLSIGIWWFVAGATSASISSDQREWYTYAPFNPNWEYQLGSSLILCALCAAAVDVVVRIVLAAVCVAKSNRLRAD